MDKSTEVKTLTESERVLLSTTDSIKVANFWQKAMKAPIYSVERQHYLDSALIIKPDSAYFWQQKAMPLYKERKFSLGKPFLEKAVLYDPERYLDYSGFMKCLFSNEYQESIDELNLAKEKFGDGYVMDHTYNFYIALDYLQMNQFANAKKYLLKSKEQQFNDFPNDSPEEACHYMDWFYMGVVEYELKNYEKAIENFNMSLKVYKKFADALYYKGISLYQSGKNEEARKTIELAWENNQNTINEDQVYYVIYPYQIFHKLSPWSTKRMDSK
nr:tetratricopeptide repeat protein [Muricauda sp. UBA7809]